MINYCRVDHDIGNPPFGHFGEEAIKSFFTEYFNDDNKKGWNDQELKDYKNFDGNVQTFRILRKLSFLKDDKSYNLSFPTLASIIKYPRSSLTGNKKKFKDIAEKKFGYFISERKDYEQINDRLSLDSERHPIVYLLEAADDIAYSAADIEDGVKIGILDFETILEILKKHLSSNDSVIKTFEDLYKENKSMNQNRLDLTVRRFRIFTQSLMIEAIFKLFFKNYKTILNGDYKHELIKKCEASQIRLAYKELSEFVYCDRQIMETEMAGWKVIKGLLNEFINASKSDNFREGSNSQEGRLYLLISSSYRYLYETYSAQYEGNDEYKKFQLIVDFISGMTDSYSLDLYQKLTGIKIS